MSGHQYPSISIHDNAQVHLGDKITYLTNNGPLVLLDSQAVDIDSLKQQLDWTSVDCNELKLLVENVKYQAPSEEPDVSELEDLESMVETLKFHLDEDDFRAGEGWQQPLQDVGRLVTRYRDSVRTMKQNVKHLQDLDTPIHLGSALTKSDVRDLRLKLSTAVAMVSFCALQSSSHAQLDEIRSLDTRLRYVLEEIENEKALRIGPGQSLKIFDVNRIDSDFELVMQRHMAPSLDTEQETIRAASMQVSTILENRSIISEFAPGDSETSLSVDDKSLYSAVVKSSIVDTNEASDSVTTITRHAQQELLSLTTVKYQWVTICVSFKISSEYEEVLRCRILANLDDEVRELKVDLLSMYGSFMAQYFDDDPDPNDLDFFYGIMEMSNQSSLRQYCHRKCSPRITCLLRRARENIFAASGDFQKPSLQDLRRIVRRNAEYKSESSIEKPVPLFEGIDFSWSDDPTDISQILPRVLALVTIGMIYDDERGRHTAIEAYSEAYCSIDSMIDKLLTPYPGSVDDETPNPEGPRSATLRQIRDEIAARLVVLDQAESPVPTFVYSKPSATTSKYRSGQKLRVLASLPEIGMIKVMDTPAAANFIPSAWDLRNGWIPTTSVDFHPPHCALEYGHQRSLSAPNMMRGGVDSKRGPSPGRPRRKPVTSQLLLSSHDQEVAVAESSSPIGHPETQAQTSLMHEARKRFSRWSASFGT